MDFEHSAFAQPDPVFVIPQHLYAPRVGFFASPQPPILFSVNGRLGVRLWDIVLNPGAELDDADDAPLESTGKKVSYRLLLAGFQPFVRQYHIRSSRNSPHPEYKTRRQIAGQIADLVQRFIHVYSLTSVLRIGSVDVDFPQIVLLGLQQVSQGSWQPVLGFSP